MKFYFIHLPQESGPADLVPVCQTLPFFAFSNELPERKLNLINSCASANALPSFS